MLGGSLGVFDSTVVGRVGATAALKSDWTSDTSVVLLSGIGIYVKAVAVSASTLEGSASLTISYDSASIEPNRAVLSARYAVIKGIRVRLSGVTEVLAFTGNVPSTGSSSLTIVGRNFARMLWNSFEISFRQIAGST